MNGSEAELVKGRAPVVLAFTALLVASPVLAGDVAVSPDGRNRIEYADGKVTVPTVWDETKGLCGEIGRFAALARRRGC